MTTTHKIIFAFDSFKGCLSSAEVGKAAAEGAEQEKVEVLNVSDGGDGMLCAFCQAYRAEQVSCNCHDALMRPIRAAYGLVGDMAIIETAQACGLSLLESNERDAVGGTSYGVGELLIDAFERGARRFIIGLGGTATTDGGFGMLKALYVHAGPAAFFDTYLPRWRNECSWTLASDVRNPLYGPQGAATVFAPQKGATPAEVVRLDARLQRLAQHAARRMGHDCSMLPGAGAAGGLGYAFLQYFGAQMQSGADLLLDALDFDTRLRDAALVITGEGSADKQTLMGKLPWHVLQRAQKAHVPCCLLAGEVSNREELLKAGFREALCIHPAGLSKEEQLRTEVTKNNLSLTTSQLLTRFFNAEIKE